jgi:transketolase
MQFPASDRLILSKGHAAVTLYAVLAHLGMLQLSAVGRFGELDSGVEGHPDMLVTPAIDFSTGSLGQGVAIGLGMALMLQDLNAHVWVVVGDGECQEGQIWEAALLAVRYQLSNLHVIVDMNGAQEMGWRLQPHVEDSPLPLASEKWKSFGWQTIECDGHSPVELSAAIRHLRCTNAPSVLLATTIKGKGISHLERLAHESHCLSLTDEEFQEAMKELNTCEAG